MATEMMMTVVSLSPDPTEIDQTETIFNNRTWLFQRRRLRGKHSLALPISSDREYQTLAPEILLHDVKPKP